MLIRANRIFVANFYNFVCKCSPRTIRDNSEIGKISAANNISCANGRNCNFAITEKTSFITCSNQFGTTFAVGIGINSVQNISFTVAENPFIVMVNFIGGDIDKRSYEIRIAKTFQNIYRTHNICRISFNGIFITFQHNRLRCKMKNYFRLTFIKNFLQIFQIANIANYRINFFIQFDNRK